MAHPTETDQSLVTVAHLQSAIAAGVAPVKNDVANLRRDVSDMSDLLGTIADDIFALAAWFRKRRRIRRWLAANASTAVAQLTGALAIAAASAAVTLLLTKLL